MGCGAGRGTVVVYEVAEKAAHERGSAEGSSSPSRPSVPLVEPSAPKPEDPNLLAKLLRASKVQAYRRLGAELEALLQDTSQGSQRPSAAPRSLETLLEWDAKLDGPKDTPYAGGVFKLALWFPETYPFKPPRAEFVTPCYHPNVSDRGKICLNILKEEWSPMLTVASLLLCISALLSQPNADDPLNIEAADAFRNNPAEFHKTAVEWTRRFALRQDAAPLSTDTSAGDVHLNSRVANMAALGANTALAARHDGGHTRISVEPRGTPQIARGRVVDEGLGRDSILKPRGARGEGSPTRGGASPTRADQSLRGSRG